MNEQDKNNQICPVCGYPAQAGHASDCSLGDKNKEVENPYSHDYSKAPEDLRKFVIPHAAEGPSTHELLVKDTDFKMPVSFHIEGNNFYITGIQSENNTGAIIWGNISGNIVNIKHIELAKSLRGTGIGKTLLVDLEEQLKNRGIGTAYSSFAKTSTVEFFLKNGYKIIPLELLTDEAKKSLDIDDKDFDQRVGNEENFRELIAQNFEFRKVLMVKKI